MRSLVVLCAVFAAAAAAPERVVKRSVAHVAYSAPAAVSHQSRVDVRTSPAVVAEEVVGVAPAVVEPVLEARAVYEAPVVYAAPAAVSHQSRVDFRSTPAVASVVAEPLLARAVYSAPTQYYGGSAVTHQSRVDVHSSPAVYSEQVAPAVVDARSVWAPSVYASTW